MHLAVSQHRGTCTRSSADTSSHLIAGLLLPSAEVQLLPGSPDADNGPPFLQCLLLFDTRAPLGPRTDAIAALVCMWLQYSGGPHTRVSTPLSGLGDLALKNREALRLGFARGRVSKGLLLQCCLIVGTCVAA